MSIRLHLHDERRLISIDIHIDPMQVIFKSAKPLSVMISGLFICKRYPIQRYFFVVVIVAGVVFFKFFEAKKPKDGKSTTDKSTNTTVDSDASYYQMLGTALLVLSLTCDGILGTYHTRKCSH